jgi:hypothetical protein
MRQDQTDFTDARSEAQEALEATAEARRSNGDPRI